MREVNMELKKFFLEYGEVSPSDFWKYIRNKHKTSYDAIRRNFWMLHKLGLIKKTRKLPHKGGCIGYKQLYKIVNADSECWYNPQACMDWESYNERNRKRK